MPQIGQAMPCHVDGSLVALAWPGVRQSQSQSVGPRPFPLMTGQEETASAPLQSLTQRNTDILNALIEPHDSLLFFCCVPRSGSRLVVAFRRLVLSVSVSLTLSPTSPPHLHPHPRTKTEVCPSPSESLALSLAPRASLPPTHLFHRVAILAPPPSLETRDGGVLFFSSSSFPSPLLQTWVGGDIFAQHKRYVLISFFLDFADGFYLASSMMLMATPSTPTLMPTAHTPAPRTLALDAHAHASTPSTRTLDDVPDAHAHVGCLAHPRCVRACRKPVRGFNRILQI